MISVGEVYMPHEEFFEKRRAGKRYDSEATGSRLYCGEIIADGQGLFRSAQSTFWRETRNVYHAFIKNSN